MASDNLSNLVSILVNRNIDNMIGNPKLVTLLINSSILSTPFIPFLKYKYTVSYVIICKGGIFFMYDLELIFITSNKKNRKIYFFNVKRDISEEYIINLMSNMCNKLDFNLSEGETIAPKTYKFIRKSVKSFNLQF